MGKMARNREREEDLCEQPGKGGSWQHLQVCAELCAYLVISSAHSTTSHLIQGGPNSRDALTELRSEVRLCSNSDAEETRVGCLFSFILSLYFLVQ